MNATHGAYLLLNVHTGGWGACHVHGALANSGICLPAACAHLLCCALPSLVCLPHVHSGAIFESAVCTTLFAADPDTHSLLQQKLGMAISNECRPSLAYVLGAQVAGCSMIV